MRKGFLVFVLLVLGWIFLWTGSVLAIDDGWMQKGVRVWYLGATGSSDAEEAYVFDTLDGNTAQVTHHSAVDHWKSPIPPDTQTYSILDKGPCWIHPQTLQNIQGGDMWQGQEIVTIMPGSFTYETLIDEFPSIPYLLLPIKALFDLQPQRNLVKIVYMIDDFSTGIAYFDADTGILLLYETSSGYVTIFFILSEINYDFATRTAFAEDNGPHTGFKSNVLKTTGWPTQFLTIQSSVETRYGGTVQMWTSTSAGGTGGGYYSPPFESYCFFGNEPELRYINFDNASYPPENWNAYGEYLWWWVPQQALQSTTIDVFDVSMTRTSTAPYTFAASGAGAGLYFSQIIFDNDGYMTDFSAKYNAIGLDLDAVTIIDQSTEVDGLDYYKNTMGTASPDPVSAPLVTTQAATSVASSTAVLNGTINPNGADTTAYFEYGTTTAYGTTATATLNSSSGSYSQDVSATLNNLQPETTYHYRLVATNSEGTVNGDDASFDTAAGSGTGEGDDGEGDGGGGGGGGGGCFISSAIH